MVEQYIRDLMYSDDDDMKFQTYMHYRTLRCKSLPHPELAIEYIEKHLPEEYKAENLEDELIEYFGTTLTQVVCSFKRYQEEEGFGPELCWQLWEEYMNMAMREGLRHVYSDGDGIFKIYFEYQYNWIESDINLCHIEIGFGGACVLSYRIKSMIKYQTVHFDILKGICYQNREERHPDLVKTLQAAGLVELSFLVESP